jgi:hypothetical protein
MLGANCLIRENDPGPERLNVGSADRPAWVERRRAVRATFTQQVLVDLGGDVQRLRGAAGRCRQAAHGDDRLGAREHSRAADLCESAVRLLTDVGADEDGWQRRRLVAQCEHDLTVALLGFGPGLQDAAHEKLSAQLAAIDAEPGSSTRVPEARPYAGPSYDPTSGRICVGQDADGRPCHWALNTAGAGVRHGLVAGPHHIGKSTLMRHIAFEAMCSRRFVVLLADPSGRDQWLEPLREQADRYADNPAETVQLLRAAVGVLDYRRREPQREDPGAQEPWMLLAIEECQHVFTPDSEATALAERIAADGGAVGVCLVVSAPGIDPGFFGQSVALRNNLARTNAVLMGEAGLGMVLELRDALQPA